jgi:hypothetical protein
MAGGAVTARFLSALIVGATILAGGAPAATVRLSPELQHRLGVVARRLAPTHRAGETDAFAKVLDPAPLIQSDSDLATAEAAAAASGPEAARAMALHKADGSVSTKDVEAARAQARSDALKVELVRRQIAAQWGPGVARLAPAARERLVHGLANGSIALVHVDTHNNDGQVGAKFVKVDVGDGSARGVVLGPARAAEPRLQSSGLIVEITGPSAILLSVGLTQSAHIETSSSQAGFLVPRGAVIRFRGSDWVFTRAGPDTFQRTLLNKPLAEADGFFVADGLSADSEVVTSGAAALFTAEQGAVP